MVHIEKVEIFGFKSFGFKNTVVKFVPGLVSISGPNGSGKSNILDAVAFALGEKNAKIMRADRLKSLIHDVEGSRAGTKIARASVHLDNADRSIPVDSDKVEVTRVLDPDGESTYYLNKQKTIRGRILDMLEVVNAGLNQLNNVQQGTITRISEFSAEEKRGAIEDLIGLSSFDERKEQATKQLEQADRRLEVALARMGEVRSRIGELEGERNHVLRHAVLSRDLGRYSTILSLQKLAAERSRAESLEVNLSRIDASLRDGTAQLGGIRERIESLESEKQVYMEEADTHGSAKSSIESEIAGALADYQTADTALKMSERSITQIDARTATIRSDILDIMESRGQTRYRMEVLRLRLAETGSRRDEIAGILTKIDRRRAAILEWQAQAAAKKAKSDRVLDLLRNTLAGHQHRLSEASLSAKQEARQAKSDRSRLAALERHTTSLEKLHARLDSWIGRQSASAESMKFRLMKLGSTRDRVVADLESLDPLIKQAGRAAVRYDSKLRLVKKVMHEDYSIGRLKTEAPGLGVLGLAYELLSWPAKCERAVMASSSDWLKALVVEDMEAMAAISETARSMNLPRLRVIPLNQLPNLCTIPGSTPELLADRISCEKRFEPLRTFLFGGVVLAGSSESAREAAGRGLRAVTLSGEYVEPGKSAILDRGSRISNLTKIISMSAEIGGLQKSIKLLESIRSRRSARLHSLDAKISSMDKRHSEKREKLASAGQSLSDLESRMRAARRTRADLSSRITSYETRLPHVQKRLARLQSLVERTTARITLEESRIPADTSKRIAAKLSKINRHKDDFERLQTQANTRYYKAEAEWDGLESSSRGLIRRASELAGEQKSLIGERQETVLKLGSMRTGVADRKRTLEGLRQREQQVIETASVSMSRLRECDSRLGTLQKQERHVSGMVSGLQRRRDSIGRDLAECREAISGIAESIPPRPPEDLPLNMDVSGLISSLKAELEALPPLNANAPGAYGSVSEGYRSMSERKNSLEQERNRIVSFIEDIEKDKRQRYLDAFDTVDNEIRAIFGKMSGGNAWLELEDEDDVFGSGITYMVQFPGKPKRTSMSISGGEKTLAAIVFVLALQKLNPSPFYLFDEVDAHLDAPNSERLANILEERSQNSQFIMVSLKEFVVQKAGLVYGVYPKNGVSQTVAYHDRRTRPVAT